jgi:glucose-6-phosphate 1-dehydrogenase
MTPVLLMEQAGSAPGATLRPAPRPADPCSFVIFGASGDMAHRLLVPALYNLAVGGLLPDAFAIIGIARGDKSEGEFRASKAGCASLPSARSTTTSWAGS